MEGLIELFCWCGERESLLLLFIDEINEAMWAVRPAPNQLRHFIHCAAPFTLLHWMKCWLAAQRGCLVGRSIKPFSFRSIQIQELKFFSFELPLKKRMFDFTIFWISCAACWIGIESCFWLRSLSLAEPLAVPPPLTHQRKRSQQLSSSNSTSFFHSNNFTSFNCFRSFTHSASLFISFSIRRGRQGRNNHLFFELPIRKSNSLRKDWFVDGLAAVILAPSTRASTSAPINFHKIKLTVA